VLTDLDATGTILQIAAAQAQQAEDLLSTESSEAEALGALLEDLDEAIQAEEAPGDDLSEALDALSDATDSAFAAAGDVSSAYDALQDQASTVGGLEGDLDYAEEEYRVAEENYENCLAQASDSEVQHQPPDCNETALQAQVDELRNQVEQRGNAVQTAVNNYRNASDVDIAARKAFDSESKDEAEKREAYEDRVDQRNVAVLQELAAEASYQAAEQNYTAALSGLAVAIRSREPVEIVQAIIALRAAAAALDAAKLTWDACKEATRLARRDEERAWAAYQAARAAKAQAAEAVKAGATNVKAAWDAWCDAQAAFDAVKAQLEDAIRAYQRCLRAGKS